MQNYPVDLDNPTDFFLGVAFARPPRKEPAPRAGPRHLSGPSFPGRSPRGRGAGSGSSLHPSARSGMRCLCAELGCGCLLAIHMQNHHLLSARAYLYMAGDA